MLKKFSHALAFSILALASFSAFSQEQSAAINKADLPDPRTSIDQSPVSAGDGGPTGLGGLVDKVKINNTDSMATDASVRESFTKKDFLPQQASVRPLKPVVYSEFQKFVQETTGKLLPIFGAEYFSNSPSTFSPISNSPIPTDYPLGPGDEVLVHGWGTIDINYRATIDRNGFITIPKIGSVLLAGVKAGNAESVIQDAIGKLYKGVNLNINFGQLRAITIYIVGQANQPGTYTVSNLSTLVTALFASGGPNANGSIRNVQVKRSGKVVAELDLYAFIAKGDKSADIKLQDSDVIYIPPAFGYVALVGKVNSPAIYELRTTKDTIENLLEFAGGLPILADPRRAFLERIDPHRNQPRSVEEFALDSSGVKKTLKNGDLLNITSITPDFSNAVVLRGNVDQPIRAPFKVGMRISDLIPNRDYLISRSSIQKQNNVLIGNENDGSNRDNLAARNATQKQNNIFAVGESDKNESRTNGATITSRIGGLIDEINWDYAVIERINRADLSVSLIPFNLGRIFDSPSSADNIFLQPGDTVTIFSQKDVLVPLDKQKIFVRIEGEVNAPGVYQMTPGENLHMLIARAGGPTRNAYLFGTAFYREQARKEQETNMNKVIDRLETQIRNEQSRALANKISINAEDAQMFEAKRQAGVISARETIARMRQLQPTGRIAFGLDPSEKSFNKLPQLKLENGDKLVIPPRPDFVNIFGALNSEASQLWRPGAQAGRYLKTAGLTPEADVENIFIIRSDGSIVSSESGSWFSGSVTNTEIMAGDNIVVPERVNRESFWTRFTVGTREWAKILADFGLGAAAIKVLR